MAFRTNKVPAIEERIVSGSSVSFNSAFALPLKACKVSFSATQAGSGDPSPSNPRAISGVSAIGLTANSTPVSISLGDTRYGGELDVLTGELTVTKKIVDLSTITGWVYQANYDRFYSNKAVTDYSMTQETADMAIFENVITSRNTELPCAFVDGGNRVFFSHTGYTEIESFLENIINGHYAVVMMKPQIIQLIPQQLSSIIGNNTFSTDVGTLEITFADLQTKSASGAVATFNTALAMPLVSCNIAVNAWQEGSGDPNPIDNIRPIHGFREVNATRAGKNLLDKSKGKIASTNPRFIAFGVDNFDDTIPNGSLWLKAGNYVFSVSGENSTLWESFGIFDSGTRIFVSYNAKFVAFTISKSGAYKFSMSIKGEVFVSWDNYDMQLEVGSTATAYEPYVTPTIYTIQLGQEVYGAEVDVVNGVAHCTHELITDLSNADWTYNPGNNTFSTASIKGYTDGEAFTCNKYLAVGYESLQNMTNNKAQLRMIGLFIKDTSYNGDAYAFKVSLADIQICKPLATPFDIQLTPTQIETLIGNNTIFADTGDIDLTFKDLDIAKRGSFREVFKLPS